MFEDQVFQFTALPFEVQTNGCNSSALASTCHIVISLPRRLADKRSTFVIHNRLVSHTKYCLQTVQSLGFISNLKKSDLIPAQKFTFIEIEFLTQQLIQSGYQRTESILYFWLSIESISFSDSSSSTNFPFSFGKTSFTTASNVSLICLETSILPLDHQVPINSMIQFHLKWWMDTNHFVLGTSIHPPDPNAFLFTDASHFEWGAHLEPMRLSFVVAGRKTNPSSISIFWKWWPFV